MPVKTYQGAQFQNEGEVRVVAELQRRLTQHHGDSYIITNILIPSRGMSREVDIVVVHERCIVAIEVKNWAGHNKFFSPTGYAPVRAGGQDPRSQIAINARGLKDYLVKECSGIRRANDIWIYELVILGNDAPVASLEVERGTPVPVALLHEGVQRVVDGILGEEGQRPRAIPATLVHQIGQKLGARSESPTNPRIIWKYTIERKLPGSHFDEYVATEQLDPAFSKLGDPSTIQATPRFRLQRNDIGLHADPADRKKALGEALVLHRSLSQLKSSGVIGVPMPKDPFLDPNDDAVLWTPYEYVEGRSIESLVKASVARKWKILYQVAKLLQRCHEENIVHRALIPESILVQSGTDVPMLLHFDFARLENSQFTVGSKLRQKLATSPYVAPEARSNPSAAGPRSDIYSLGVIALALYTGRSITQNEEIGQRLPQIRDTEFRDLVTHMLADFSHRIAHMEHVVQRLSC